MAKREATNWVVVGIYAFGGAASLLLIVGFAYMSAYFEAAAYNRITGKNVSAWDAMFVKLRVDGEARSSE